MPYLEDYMAKQNPDAKAVSYAEVVGDLGGMAGKLQEAVKPYSGSIVLDTAPDVSYDSTRQDKDGHNVIYRVSVQMSVSYDPRKLHQDILRSLPPEQRTAQGGSELPDCHCAAGSCLSPAGGRA
jgi:hypothetical protein